jgi:hypothetical protein
VLFLLLAGRQIAQGPESELVADRQEEAVPGAVQLPVNQLQITPLQSEGKESFV